MLFTLLLGALGTAAAEAVAFHRTRTRLAAEASRIVPDVGSASVFANAPASARASLAQFRFGTAAEAGTASTATVAALASADTCDCSFNSTMACCGTNEAVLRGRLESSLKTLKEYIASERDHRLDASSDTLKLLKDMMALKDQEMEYKTKLAARNASYVAAMKVKSAEQTNVAAVAARSAQAARLEAARQYASLDAARAAREVAGAVRVEEVGKAKGAIDTAATEAVKAVAGGTKDVVEKTAYAASAAAMAKVAQEAAASASERARKQSVRAKVAAASAAAAQQRMHELEQKAHESADAAAAAEAIAQQDRARAAEASAALQAMMAQAAQIKEESSKSTETAASDLTVVASQAFEAIEKAQEDAAKALNDATETAIISAVAPTSTLPADPQIVAETPTLLPSPPRAGPPSEALLHQAGDAVDVAAASFVAPQPRIYLPNGFGGSLATLLSPRVARLTSALAENQRSATR